jgi:hypothetical protein
MHRRLIKLVEFPYGLRTNLKLLLEIPGNIVEPELAAFRETHRYFGVALGDYPPVVKLREMSNNQFFSFLTVASGYRCISAIPAHNSSCDRGVRQSLCNR